jgi:GcrA cell cycle regulator
MVWDEETIRVLKDLWAQGHSTAEIGRRLSVSKNAIVGKAHRLELDARPSPIRRDIVNPSPERPESYPRLAGATLPPLASTNAQPIAPASRASSPPASLSTTPLSTTAVPAATAAPVLNSQAPVSRSSAPPLSYVQPVRVSTMAPRPDVQPRPPAASPRPAIPAAPVQIRRSVPSCCWPIGEPGTKTFRFCDDTSLPGKPYCDEHARLAYVRVRDRKEDAA